MQLITLKYNHTIIVALLLCTSLSFGQKRIIDHEAFCISPAGEVINGESLPLEFGYLHHGPDILYDSDTCVYRLITILPDGTKAITYQGTLRGNGNRIIPVGERQRYAENYVIPFTLSGLEEPYTFDYCVEISSFRITANLDTLPYVSWMDSNPGNDRCCEKVTIMPKPASTAIAIRQSAEGIWVYPNPVRDRFYIRTSADFAKEDMQMMLFDISGRLLRERYYAAGDSAEDTRMVDVAGIPSGIYYLHLQSAKGVVSRKIVVN